MNEAEQQLDRADEIAQGILIGFVIAYGLASLLAIVACSLYAWWTGQIGAGLT